MALILIRGKVEICPCCWREREAQTLVCFVKSYLTDDKSLRISAKVVGTPNLMVCDCFNLCFEPSIPLKIQ